MSNPLDKLCGPGKPLQTEAPDASELAGLLRGGTLGQRLDRCHTGSC